ncbi:hypothetical protein ACVWXM_006906 [Bradyrhizobium sp. GM7.3]
MGRRPIRAPLNVYLNARLVGRLRRESSGAIDFQYDEDLAGMGERHPGLGIDASTRRPLYR